MRKLFPHIPFASGAMTPILFGSAAVHIAVLSLLTLGTMDTGPEGGGLPSFDVSYIPGSAPSEVPIGGVARSASDISKREDTVSQPKMVEIPAPDYFIVPTKVKPKVVPRVEQATVQKTFAPRVPESASMLQPVALVQGGGMGTGRGEGDFTGNGEGGGGGIARASVLDGPKPRYPYSARMAGFEGRVVLDVVVSADGTVSAASVAKSSGRDDCDASALDTLRSEWSFKPAVRNGLPVESRERVVIVYNLRELG